MAIVGTIEFPSDSENPIRASWDSEVGWQCGRENWLQLLQSEFSLADYSPAHGRPGVKLLHDAAQRLKGHVVSIVLAPPDPDGDQKVY